ncbi:hypothetical protein F9K33_08215 [bacterium]|nr:MAG: hypothetical protein F9K33_08215 [bacterium]
MFKYLVIVFLLISTSAIAGTMSDGDQEFVRMNYPAAEDIYLSILTQSPKNADILWRLSRVYVCIGDVTQDHQRETYYRKAVEYARKSIEANYEKSEGHSWLAASLGSIAMFEGSRRKVELCREIKSELDLAVKLNPKDDVAYTIMGSFYRALGGISWVEHQLANLLLGGLPDGGYKDGEAAFKNAIQISPNVLRHHFELGMLYYESGRKEEAKKELKIANSMPIQLASDARRKQVTQKILAEF